MILLIATVFKLTRTKFRPRITGHDTSMVSCPAYYFLMLIERTEYELNDRRRGKPRVNDFIYQWCVSGGVDDGSLCVYSISTYSMDGLHSYRRLLPLQYLLVAIPKSLDMLPIFDRDLLMANEWNTNLNNPPKAGVVAFWWFASRWLSLLIAPRLILYEIWRVLVGVVACMYFSVHRFVHPLRRISGLGLLVRWNHIA